MLVNKTEGVSLTIRKANTMTYSSAGIEDTKEATKWVEKNCDSIIVEIGKKRTRFRKIFKALDIRTIKDLRATTIEDVKHTPGIGQVTVEEFHDAVADMTGFSLVKGKYADTLPIDILKHREERLGKSPEGKEEEREETVQEVVVPSPLPLAKTTFDHRMLAEACRKYIDCCEYFFETDFDEPEIEEAAYDDLKASFSSIVSYIDQQRSFAQTMALLAITPLYRGGN